MTTVVRLSLAVLIVLGLIGCFQMSVESADQTVAAGETAFFKLAVVNVGWESLPVTLETVGGCTVEPPVLIPDAGAVLACALAPGTYTVVVTGTSVYHTEAVTAVVTVEPWRVWLPIVTNITGLTE